MPGLVVHLVVEPASLLANFRQQVAGPVQEVPEQIVQLLLDVQHTESVGVDRPVLQPHESPRPNSLEQVQGLGVGGAGIDGPFQYGVVPPGGGRAGAVQRLRTARLRVGGPRSAARLLATPATTDGGRRRA